MRKTSLAAGLIYLLTFISVPTLFLYLPIHHPDYMLGSGPDSDTVLGAILEIIVGLSGIGTAVVLYPVLKKQNESLALGLVGARVLEAATIFAGVASLITVVALRQSGAGADMLPTGRALVLLYDRTFLIGQSFIPAIDDLLLGILLFQSRLIPRGLAVIGLLGAPVLVSADIAVLFGLLEQRDPFTMMAAIPVAVFEFSLGVLLVVKGFHTPAQPDFSN